jgi:hypothetical protein
MPPLVAIPLIAWVSLLLWSLLAAAPAGLLLGLFFPTGIRWLEQQGRADWLPWAWGGQRPVVGGGGPYRGAAGGGHAVAPSDGQPSLCLIAPLDFCPILGG